MTTYWTDDWADLARAAVAQSDVDAREFAERVIRRTNATRLRELALAEVVGWIEHFRRETAREVERAASRGAEEQKRLAVVEAPNPPVDRGDPVADPTILQFDRIDGMSESGYPVHDIWNARQYRPFVARLVKEGDYDEWYERGCRAEREAYKAGLLKEGFQGEYFASTFYIDGPQAWEREQLRKQMIAVVDTHAKRVRLETTAELLGTIFALGDGRRVTWGSATVADHQQRLDMLLQNATGIAETAALHRKAITMLTAAGAACLSQLNAEGRAAA